MLQIASSIKQNLDPNSRFQVANCHGRQVRLLQMVGAGAQGAVFKAQVRRWEAVMEEESQKHPETVGPGSSLVGIYMGS